MIAGNHDLLGFETKLIGDYLHRVDGSAIDRGLTRLAQASVTDGRSETFKQALEGGRPTVHVGRLDYFGREEFSQSGPTGVSADRKINAAGEVRSAEEQSAHTSQAVSRSMPMSTRRIGRKPLSASSDLLTRGKLLAISDRRVVPHKTKVAARW